MRFLARLAMEVTLIGAMIAVALLIGMHYGEKQGLKQALSTNPVSEQLELVCAGLWVGKQNEKAYTKGND
jgi:putative exporter of polyketide antibiotics